MKTNRGFSIIEVMVSMVILAIVIANILPAFAYQMRVNTRAELRTQAMEAGQRVVDDLRFIPPNTLPTAGAGTINYVTIGDRTYLVTPHYCLRAAYCAAASSRHITVRVAFKGTQLYETETVYTTLQ